MSEYLEVRFPQHRLPEGLTPQLYQRTDGNPLFIVNLVDYLAAQEVIISRNGQWVALQVLLLGPDSTAMHKDIGRALCRPLSHHHAPTAEERRCGAGPRLSGHPLPRHPHRPAARHGHWHLAHRRHGYTPPNRHRCVGGKRQHRNAEEGSLEARSEAMRRERSISLVVLRGGPGGTELHQAKSIRIRHAGVVVPYPPIVRRSLWVSLG